MNGIHMAKQSVRTLKDSKNYTNLSMCSHNEDNRLSDDHYMRNVSFLIRSKMIHSSCNDREQTE